MGRNSRDDYQWLVDELLAVEDEKEVTEEEPEETLNWWEGDEDSRNTGWSVGIYEDDEGFDENAALLAMTPRDKRRQELLERRQHKAEKKQKHAQKKKKSSGIGGLMLLALLEVLGILAIIGWWIQWLT